MKMAIKHSIVHLLHPDSGATFIAHDVPLMHAGRCKGARLLIKRSTAKKKREVKLKPRLEKTRKTGGKKREEETIRSHEQWGLTKPGKRGRKSDEREKKKN